MISINSPNHKLTDWEGLIRQGGRDREAVFLPLGKQVSKLRPCHSQLRRYKHLHSITENTEGSPITIICNDHSFPAHLSEGRSHGCARVIRLEGRMFTKIVDLVSENFSSGPTRQCRPSFKLWYKSEKQRQCRLFSRLGTFCQQINGY